MMLKRDFSHIAAILEAAYMNTLAIDYSRCMDNWYSELADTEAAELMEEQLIADLHEEYMWYKHEDYMLWKNKPLEEKLAETVSYKEAVTITVFAVDRDIEDMDIPTILELWNDYTKLSLKLGYSMDFICDTVLYNVVTNPDNYGELYNKAKSVFCK